VDDIPSLCLLVKVAGNDIEHKAFRSPKNGYFTDVNITGASFLQSIGAVLTFDYENYEFTIHQSRKIYFYTGVLRSAWSCSKRNFCKILRPLFNSNKKDVLSFIFSCYISHL
jgi:hypothetical protein